MHKMILPLLSFYEKTFTKPHAKLPGNELLGFLKKKLGHKSVALLIDNASHLTDKNLAMIKSLKKEKLRLQVVVASTPKEYEKSRLSEIGSDELNITLRRLAFDEAKEMIKCRVEAFGGKGIHPFTEEELKKVYDKADKNPRKFLKLCRDEAIKILIHKRELLEKHASTPRPPQPLKKSPKKTKAGGAKVDVKARKAGEKEAKGEKKEEKERHRLIKIKFALGKSQEELARKKHPPVHHAEKDERRAIHDEEHKQELLNNLSSTSPRRKTRAQEPEDDKAHLSETDKLLKELAEEFEVD